MHRFLMILKPAFLFLFLWSIFSLCPIGAIEKEKTIPFGERVIIKGVLTLEKLEKKNGGIEKAYILVPYILGKPFMVDWSGSLADKRIRIIPNGRISKKDLETYIGLAGKLTKSSDPPNYPEASLSVGSVTYQERIKKEKVEGRRLILFASGGCGMGEAIKIKKDELLEIERIRNWAKKNQIEFMEGAEGDLCDIIVKDENTAKYLEVNPFSSQEVIRDCEIFFSVKRPSAR